MEVIKIVAAVYLAVLSVWDIRKKVVPGWMLAAGAVLCAAGCIQPGAPCVLEHVLGGSIGLILLIISFITKEAVGRADCILIVCLGTFLGLFQCIKMLSVSLVLCCIFCMAGMGFRLVTRKYRVAFIPFLFTGFLCCL